jgi:hypothetical protein
MDDLIFIALTLVSLGLSLGFIALCDRLMEGTA